MSMERGIDTRLLTSAEVCRRLGICFKTMQVLRNQRKIAYVRFGHRLIRFREEAVREFVRQREKSQAFAEEFCSYHGA